MKLCDRDRTTVTRTTTEEWVSQNVRAIRELPITDVLIEDVRIAPHEPTWPPAQIGTSVPLWRPERAGRPVSLTPHR